MTIWLATLRRNERGLALTSGVRRRSEAVYFVFDEVDGDDGGGSFASPQYRQWLIDIDGIHLIQAIFNSLSSVVPLVYYLMER